ncbi:hypothetical protein ACFH04_25310 [Streptomyces noboritoensis]|uniref:ANTAR domain-containing protein n=1 Tax=Streptomyces noboritoensis TaxID=67337 RepID=A0ABV6TMK2_9ACTN
MSEPNSATSERPTLMAVGDLRDALAALERGKVSVAVAALMAIDEDSWRAMERRVAAVGGDLRGLLLAAADGNTGLLTAG